MKPGAPVAEVKNAGDMSMLVMLDLSDHRIGSYLCSRSDGARNVGHQNRAFGVGSAAVVAEPTINTRRPVSVWCTQSREWSGCNKNAELPTTTHQHLSARVQFMLALRIPFSSSAPR